MAKGDGSRFPPGGEGKGAGPALHHIKNATGVSGDMRIDV